MSLYVVLSVDFGRLDERSCKQILFQIEGSGILSGIERGGFTAALLGGEHYNLFSDREVQQFTNAANNSDLFKPIRSACQRLGGWVLWAVYNTLLSTSNSPGAVQHADIASKLQESVFQSLGECDHACYGVSCFPCLINHSALEVFRNLNLACAVAIISS